MSGIGFAVLLCLLALHSLVVGFELLFNPGSDFAFVKASNNPIRSDMDALMAIIQSGTFFASSVYVALFVHSRKKMADVFNELNSIWVT